MRDFHELKTGLLGELDKAIGEVDGDDINKLVDMLLASRKIFVMGAGRTMLMCQAFAKRLSHLGLDAHVVGETVTPPIADGDLLIACSCSGETTTTVDISRLAKRYGAKLVSVTSDKNSTLRGLSDMSVYIGRKSGKSISPMASLFEEALLIVFDCIALLIKERLGVEEEKMQTRHANLE